MLLFLLLLFRFLLLLFRWGKGPLLDLFFLVRCFLFFFGVVSVVGGVVVVVVAAAAAVISVWASGPVFKFFYVLEPVFQDL